MVTINGTDVHDDIAKLVRTNHMSLRLTETLLNLTSKAAVDALNACENKPPGEQAFDIMANTSYETARHTLAKATQQGGAFRNYINAFITDFDQWLDHHAREVTLTALNKVRRTYTAEYGFAVITPEAIAWIAQWTRHAELLEVGAGNAYLAHRLTEAGVSVIPTDAHTLADNPYHLGSTYHMSVIQIDALSAITELNDLNLLWSWPPPEQASGQALQRFNGQFFVYIGEQWNGCTGGTMFQEVLDANFEYCASFGIPSFPAVNDSIAVYRRIA